MSQAGGFTGDALKDVVDEGVHDAHGLGGDAAVGVDLLQDRRSLSSWTLPHLSALGGGLADGRDSIL